MSTINDMGIPGVGSSIFEPKKTNLYRVTFAGMGGGNDSQPVSMQVIQVSRPKLSHAEIELHRYNSTAYTAGKYKWDPMSMVVEDDVIGSATRVLQAQQQKQQWLIGAEGQWLAQAGEASLFKFVTYLDMMDGNDQVIEKWTYEGCWIMEADYGQLAYTGNEAVKINLSIRFDHARQTIGGYKQGLGIATGGAGKILAQGTPA